MHFLFFILTLMAGVVAHAEFPWDVGPCSEKGIQSSDFQSAMHEDSRSFYQGKVQFHKLYVGEPACCGTILAVVIPLSSGGKKCVAVTHINGLDLKRAVADYDPDHGLRVVIPTTDYNPETGGSKTGKLMVLRVNLALSSVRVE